MRPGANSHIFGFTLNLQLIPRIYIAIHRLAPFILSYSEENVFLLANLENQSIFIYFSPIYYEYDLSDTSFESEEGSDDSDDSNYRPNAPNTRVKKRKVGKTSMMIIVVFTTSSHVRGRERYQMAWTSDKLFMIEMSFPVNFQKSFKRIDDM